MREDRGGSNRPIEQTLKEYGAWYLLLRAHDHIWKDYGWGFNMRWDASHFLWEFANQVEPSAGRV